MENEEESQLDSFKWLVVIPFADTIPITDKEYGAYQRTLCGSGGPEEGTYFKLARTGEILPLNPTSILKNPDYVDLERKKKFEIYSEIISEYKELKAQGAVGSWNEYVKWRKQKVKEFKQQYDKKRIS